MKEIPKSKYKVVLTQNNIALIDDERHRQVQITVKPGTDLTALMHYLHDAKNILKKDNKN